MSSARSATDLAATQGAVVMTRGHRGGGDDVLAGYRGVVIVASTRGGTFRTVVAAHGVVQQHRNLKCPDLGGETRSCIDATPRFVRAAEQESLAQRDTERSASTSLFQCFDPGQ